MACRVHGEPRDWLGQCGDVILVKTPGVTAGGFDMAFGDRYPKSATTSSKGMVLASATSLMLWRRLSINSLSPMISSVSSKGWNSLQDIKTMTGFPSRVRGIDHSEFPKSDILGLWNRNPRRFVLQFHAHAGLGYILAKYELVDLQY